MSRHEYTEEQEEFLRQNVNGISLAELTKKINEAFNLSLSENAIAARKRKLRIVSGVIGGRFEKGHVSWNKGTKGLSNQGGNKTSFKKGNIPYNRRKMTDERITKDGYTEIKIQDGKLNKNWILKHRYIYEQKYGKIPKGCKIIFKDGNRKNVNINNLILVSAAEELIMNRQGLFNKNGDITETGALIAKVINKTNKRIRGK